MKILALETSCDDTAAAIVEDGRTVLASVMAGQVDLHAPYGGVIPENAAREHLTSINACIATCLAQANLGLHDIDAFAATLGPGLIGSLLVGANTAKTLSVMTGKPFLGVHHLHGHIASNYLDSQLEPPFLCLLVSGGHTQLVHVPSLTQWHIMGQTQDDAVGEAYDKVARLLGLGFPGGPIMDQRARLGNPKAYALPTASMKHPWDFSFSGLKTATSRLIEQERGPQLAPLTDDTINNYS
jgi:N6-L-threonylcarbamoyladenine synthase